MCRIVRPTFSMSVVRNDFWTLAARGYGGSCWPRKYGLNWTIPAVVSSSEGSFGISEEEGTTVCPRSSKKERNARRMSAPRIEASVAAADQASLPTPPHPHTDTKDGHRRHPPPRGAGGRRRVRRARGLPGALERGRPGHRPPRQDRHDQSPPRASVRLRARRARGAARAGAVPRRPALPRAT